MKTIQDRLRWILTERKTSQRALSKKAGLSASHVSLILNELGQDVRRSTLDKLADAAGVSREWLATGRGAPDAEAPGVPVVRVEPEPQVRTPASDEVPLETALFNVWPGVREGFLPADFDAARRAVRETYTSVIPGADLAALARSLLVAARQLRREGLPTLPGSVWTRAASGRWATAEPEDDAPRTPGPLDEALNAALDRQRRREERRREAGMVTEETFSDPTKKR